MRFDDDAIILNRKRFGDNSFLFTILTKNNGLIKAFAKFSRKNMHSYEIGTYGKVSYFAKENSKYGNIKMESITSFALSVLDNEQKFATILSACLLIEHIFKPSQGEAAFFDNILEYFTQFSSGDNILKDYVRFELFLLKSSGFGLDLSKCTVSGSKDNLAFISPKTGSVVSLEHGLPYKDRLFKLPRCFIDNSGVQEPIDYIDGLDITFYFLNKYFSIQYKEHIMNYRDTIIRLK